GTAFVETFTRKKGIILLLRRPEPFGQAAAVVFGHPAFPFKKVSNGLGFDPHLNSSEAGEQKVHLVAKSFRRTKIRGCAAYHLNISAPQFEQSPARRQFLGSNQASRG